MKKNATVTGTVAIENAFLANQNDASLEMIEVHRWTRYTVKLVYGPAAILSGEVATSFSTLCGNATQEIMKWCVDNGCRCPQIRRDRDGDMAIWL